MPLIVKRCVLWTAQVAQVVPKTIGALAVRTEVRAVDAPVAHAREQLGFHDSRLSDRFIPLVPRTGIEPVTTHGKNA